MPERFKLYCTQRGSGLQFQGPMVLTVDPFCVLIPRIEPYETVAVFDDECGKLWDSLQPASQ